MDITDKATEVEELHRRNALNACKKIHVQATEDCIECGLQIRSERQIATGGTDTCISCAEYLEQQRKLRFGQ